MIDTQEKDGISINRYFHLTYTETLTSITLIVSSDSKRSEEGRGEFGKRVKNTKMGPELLEEIRSQRVYDSN